MGGDTNGETVDFFTFATLSDATDFADFPLSPDGAWTTGRFLQTRTVNERHVEAVRAKTNRL